MERINHHFKIPGHDGSGELSNKAYWDWVAQREGPIAAVIDRRDRRGLKNLYIDMLQKKALSEVLDITDAVLLDFGCGSGRFFPLTVGHAKCVVGLEISQQMLAHARQFGQPGQLELILFDGRSSPFAENSFEAVVSVGTIQCLTDDSRFQDTIHQIVACVKPGGRIYLVEQVRVQKKAWQRTADEYRNAFRDCGCSCIQSYPVRNGRSLMLYAIRYGLIPRRWFPGFVRHELKNTRCHRPAPWVPYQDHLFEFSKP